MYLMLHYLTLKYCTYIGRVELHTDKWTNKWIDRQYIKLDGLTIFHM